MISKSTGIRIKAYLLLLASFFLKNGDVHSQTFQPGVSIFDSTGYVEYVSGNLPVVISVPHGGYLEPNDLPDRDCDRYTCISDSFTEELGRSIGNAFFEQTGCYPHLIFNLLDRKKFDANRDITEAADGNATVEHAWHSYHRFIDSAKARIVEDFGRGLFLDLHGHGHNIQRVELGYRISKSELQLPDDELNADQYIEKSSIQTLVGDNLLSLTHSELLRGDFSFGTLLEENNVPAVPSNSDPFPVGNEGYFSGGYNTGRHGSANGGDIDGIQIECHQTIRFDDRLRDKFADDLVRVTNEYINTHYNSRYENNYCNLVTNVTENSVQNYVKMFPNPATDYLNLDSENEGIEISIYNYLGQRVHTYHWSGRPIDISILESGYYIIELRNGSALIGSRKLIKY